MNTSFQHDFDEDNISSSPYQKKEKEVSYQTLFKTFMDQVKVYEILDIYTLSAQSFYHALCPHYKTFFIMIIVLNEV